jgi:hypothetical protein
MAYTHRSRKICGAMGNTSPTSQFVKSWNEAIDVASRNPKDSSVAWWDGAVALSELTAQRLTHKCVIKNSEKTKNLMGTLTREIQLYSTNAGKVRDSAEEVRTVRRALSQMIKRLNQLSTNCANAKLTETLDDVRGDLELFVGNLRAYEPFVIRTQYRNGRPVPSRFPWKPFRDIDVDEHFQLSVAVALRDHFGPKLSLATISRFVVLVYICAEFVTVKQHDLHIQATKKRLSPNTVLKRLRNKQMK